MSAAFRYEQAVIGAAILGADRHGGIDLEPTDFENDLFARVWAHIRDVRQIDVVDLEAKFLGDRAAIGDAVASVPTAAGLEKAAARVRELADRRRFIGNLRQAAKMVQEGGAIDDARHLILSIEDRSTGEARPLSDHLVEAYHDIERAQTHGEQINFVASGFAEFDAAFGGLQRDGLIIVAGRPSMGKSSFAASLARDAGRRGSVLMISMEMTGRQLAHRFFASEAEVDLQRMAQGKLSTEDWRRLAQVTSSLSESGIHINDKPSRSVTDVVAEGTRFKRKHPDMQLLVVDYLGLLDLPDAQTKADAIGNATRAMKRLAGEIGCPVVLLAQLNRKLEDRANKQPTMADLRDSGSVEQDADQIIFPFRPEVYNEDKPELKGLAIIIMAKNRNGVTGKVQMRWHAPSATFKSGDCGGFDA